MLTLASGGRLGKVSGICTMLEKLALNSSSLFLYHHASLQLALADVISVTRDYPERFYRVAPDLFFSAIKTLQHLENGMFLDKLYYFYIQRMLVHVLSRSEPRGILSN